jgi:hypothetical protein
LNKLLLAIQKRIQLVLKNCPELFARDDFCVHSTSIELAGFQWFLEATTKKKSSLGLFLHAKPPSDFTGNYRVKVDRLVIQT